jgi:hypothetical protein
MRATTALILAAALAACLTGCGGKPSPPPTRTMRLAVGGGVLTAEVADTEELRRRGLMYRKELPADRGMLFVFPDEEERSFWMANTSVPLSIAFLDSGGRIVSIRDMAPFDEAQVRSGAPARFALEVNRGWFKEHGAGVGAQVYRAEQDGGGGGQELGRTP